MDDAPPGVEPRVIGRAIRTSRDEPVMREDRHIADAVRTILVRWRSAFRTVVSTLERLAPHTSKPAGSRSLYRGSIRRQCEGRGGHKLDGTWWMWAGQQCTTTTCG